MVDTNTVDPVLLAIGLGAITGSINGWIWFRDLGNEATERRGAIEFAGGTLGMVLFGGLAGALAGNEVLGSWAITHGQVSLWEPLLLSRLGLIGHRGGPER